MEIICLDGVKDCGKQKKNITERQQLNDKLRGQSLGLGVVHMCSTGGAHVGHTEFM